MASKRAVQITCGLALYLLFVGVVAYAFFQQEVPEEPVRLVFPATAGKVLFDHQTHTGDAGYGLACKDCHHHPEDEDEVYACKYCHLTQDSETFAESCMDCHDEDELEGTEMLKSADAFHDQCMGCHEEYGRGPGPGPDDCSKCHLL